MLFSDNICKTSKNDIESINKEPSSKLVLYAKIGSTKYYLAQIIAQYSGKCLTIKQIDKNKMSFGDIKLETADGTLYDDNAIAFFLSNSQLRREDDFFASSQVLQWMSYAQNHILPAVSGWVLSSLGVSISENMKSNAKVSKEELFYSLKRLDGMLKTRTYLIEERITLADISIFIALLPLYEHVFDHHHRQQHINLSRWFSTILNQPQVKAVIKDFKFCSEAVRC